MNGALRIALAVLLVALAAVFAWISLGPLHQLWTPADRDSPLSTYLLFGLPFVAAALACLVAAALLLKSR